jgi:hypothetical protein
MIDGAIVLAGAEGGIQTDDSPHRGRLSETSAEKATPVESNPAWQRLNATLGTNLKINQVLQADYAARWGR